MIAGVIGFIGSILTWDIVRSAGTSVVNVEKVFMRIIWDGWQRFLAISATLLRKWKEGLANGGIARENAWLRDCGSIEVLDPGRTPAEWHSAIILNINDWVAFQFGRDIIRGLSCSQSKDKLKGFKVDRELRRY